MKLVCIEGKDRDLLWELTADNSVIGRNSLCDVVLTDPKVSRIHAEVVHEGDSFVIYDRNSRNGCYVNNNRVAAQTLSPGDTIKLGNTPIKVISDGLTASVSWLETNPCITNEISLNRLSTQTKEVVSPSRTRREKKPSLAGSINLQIP